MGLSLKSIEIKSQYDSDIDNLVTDFYLPVFSESLIYYRRSGFFSSSSLAVCAQGIGDFIRNNGQMKLICNVNLSELDYKSLKKAQENPEKFLEESSFADEFNHIEDDIERDHVEALGWMLANGFLEIKIAFTKSGKGIYHPKVGVFIDENNDFISFSGSENASFQGLVNNIEEFKVARSWGDYREKDWSYRDLEKFKNEWNGNSINTVVVDLPKAMRDEIIKFAPHEKADLAVLKKNYKKIFSKKKAISLRDYQTDAVEFWSNNNYCCIFNMATGAGKTYTALGCVKKLMTQEDNFLTIIVSPQKHLIDQWADNIIESMDNSILITSDNNNWKTELNDLLTDFKEGFAKYPIILTTFNKFSSLDFIQIIQKFKKTDIFLIVDEVHGVGSTEFSKGLLERYNYRLGLSATPERWFDEGGTQFLYEYFSDKIYTFSIEEAMERGILTKYFYYPHFVELTDDEFEEYVELTRKIATMYDNKDNEEDIALTSQYIKRQAIIDNASDKFSKLKDILGDLQEQGIHHLLIYCSSKHRNKIRQIDEVEKILNNFCIVSHQFTGHEKTSKEEKFNGLSQKQNILKRFEEGTYQVLTAMKCLDEGVDVPSAEIAILMASTSNPREHIQRRGRLLRRSPGKKYAIIHDLIVLPSSQQLTGSEKNIVKKELERYDEFAKLSENKGQSRNKLHRKWSI